MNEEIQRADPRLRRIAAIAFAGGIAVAVIALFAFHTWLMRATAAMTAAEAVARMHVSVGICSTAIALCLAVLAAYCARLARTALEAQRWPPATMRVLADTRVLRGAPALRVGRLLNGLALVLLAAGFAAALYGWNTFTGR